MLWRLAVVVGVLALSTAAGLVWQRRTGRFRAAGQMTTVASIPGPTPEPAESPVVLSRSLNGERLGSSLGSRATLVQFSSAFCAPCRATRILLADVAGIVPGVEHIEIDAESHLDLVRDLKVLSTPTAWSSAGLPKRQLVLAALAHAMPTPGLGSAHVAR